MSKILILVIAFLTSACSNHHLTVPGTINIQSVYSNFSNSNYYEDVKYLKSEQMANGSYNHQFVASIVASNNENQNVDARYEITDTNGNLICPRVNVLVNRNSNHIIIDSCYTDEVQTKLKVKVYAKTSELPEELVKEYSFTP